MNDKLNNMLQSYGVNPFMRNAVESYIKELEGRIVKDSALIGDLNGENIALREEVSKLKVELGRITTFLLMPK